ncbi:CRISPR-associated endoribonuclease Cas6 [Stygiolobus caldivivus]|uniref:CRISPR-associated endoribonuclease n=1 Tax=Stygiolobus caldivivus TaxID=2824673 RepID=A0A8D5ZF66_9CREN|nr:CRISPR-associated endoribonuclease Cas6 [Stygiolobus caldivivus]BCU70078.1 CRISPR-associated endoribonuclease [Stygiolobus caldivivus]
MRLYIKARLIEGYIPVHYNYYLQSFFYKSFPGKVRKDIHDSGVRLGPRKFKMFTFSRVYGDFERRGDRLYYKDYVYFAFSSALSKLVKYVYERVNAEPQFNIGKAKLEVDKMAMREFDKELAKRGSFYTLSPVVVTKKTGDTSNYYFPHQLEYTYLLQMNAKRKVLALTGKALKTDIEVRFDNWKRAVVRYKGTRVEGARGKLKVRGPLTALKVVYEAGLGVKNSQGFGMLEYEGVSIRGVLGE